MLFIKGKMFYKIIDFIINIVINTNELLLKILYILDSDIRRDIYIGITGLTVAIIIFVADVISNKKYEIEKRVILTKTEIIKNMKTCILICFMMLISSMVKCSYDNPTNDLYIECDPLYITLQMLINVLILRFMYKTFVIFKSSVRLNTDKEYFNKELDNYVYNRSLIFEKKASKKSFKNIKKLKKDFEGYIKHKKILSYDMLKFELSEELYVPIHADKRGTIKSYNYKKIDSMIENIGNISNEEVKDYIKENECIFIFAKKIGEKVEKNGIVAYCLKGYKKYFEDFSNCIVYDENSVYIEDEIKLILKNLFELANDYSEPNDFDENRKLFNYLNYLYKNNLDGVRSYFIYQLEETARIVYKDKYKNLRYAIFLNSISSLAYDNDNYDEYKKISILIYYLFFQQLKIDDNDNKMVAYNYANHYFKYDYFSIKKNSDIRFYDDLMSNLLRFICVLIREKDFEVLKILLNNITLDYDRSYTDDFDEKDILDFQFAIGIIQCLVLLVEKKEISNEDKKEILYIIDWTRRFFINTYDAWLIIMNFKKYYSQKSSIQYVYEHLEFDFIDHKYLSSWSCFLIDKNIILKELLCAFKISAVFKDSINYDEITKDDKYYFDNLLKLISTSKKTKFEQELNINHINSNLIESLQLVIQDASNKEREYIKSNKLNNNKVKEFEKIIKENALKNTELEDYLNELNKIEKIDLKIKSVCGSNQLIPRDVFFKDYVGHDGIAKQFGDIFETTKEKEFVKKIDGISEESKDNINDVLKKIVNIEDYLLITSYMSSRIINEYDGFSDYISINGQKMKIMRFSQINNIYLIEKKYLPKLQYCDFDDNYNKKNIVGSLYYELTDCSKDKKLRDEIINKSSWLSEKGNITEQHEYLKQHCILKIFMAFRFHKIKNSKALKFTIKDKK